MDFTSRTGAALLFVLLAAQGGPAPAQAASFGKSVCAGANAHGKRCLPAYRRNGGALRPSAMATLRRPAFGGPLWRRRKIYAGGEAAVPQLSPRLHPRRVSALRFDEGGRDACGRRKDCREERNLADALIQRPSAATARILRETGIPAIPDVPPIVILRPDDERWPREMLGTLPR
jgi:hypothetical protein